MKKIEALALSTFFLLLSFTHHITAQSGTISAGNIATGSGGSVDYTIGQVIYMHATGSTGSVNHGLQQPFVIQAVTGIKDHSIDLYYRLYPNPTSDFIVLNIDKESTYLNGSSYSIFNINGELVSSGEIEGKQTLIPMKELVSATYFIRTFLNDIEVKTFRVIKN